jgi:uncharacterized protein YndB with AHSA1/START domain
MATGAHTFTVSTTIAADPDAIFALIIDLPNYDKWLPQSPVFTDITKISDDPIKVGTRYIEKSPGGKRDGEVLSLDAATRHVRFHQTMKIWPEFLGLVIDVVVDIKVVEKAKGESGVQREVVATLPWIFGPLSGSIIRQFEMEMQRIMTELKAHFEGIQA